MANAKKCDRCNRFYDKNLKYRGRNSTNEFIDGISYTTTEGHYKSVIDLCDDCLTDLDKFLGGAKLTSSK